MTGLPSGDVGRIGLNISPANPDVLYVVVEAKEDKGGVFKSTDRGASWSKQGPYSTSGNYYQKIFCDPKDVNKIFVINAYMVVSKDGGKTFSNLGEKRKHIDNHVIWIDPNNTSHYLVGCDGGLYESFDAAENWLFKPNLPVTQFYKVATDNALPFYHIHGGTQDNFSIGGPSRTLSSNGIFNSDWYFTSTGDGFESQVDQSNPDIVYAQAQYGSLSRYNKKSGELLYKKTQLFFLEVFFLPLINLVIGKPQWLLSSHALGSLIAILGDNKINPAISGYSAANFNANVPPVDVAISIIFLPNFFPIA